MGRPRKPIGRKPIVTNKILEKLEMAFAYGSTDEEACFYAEISVSTLYNYQNKNKGFLDRKNLLKTRPILEARRSVVDHLKTDGHLALKYLERKVKSEFATRSELTGADGDQLPTPILGTLNVYPNNSPEQNNAATQADQSNPGGDERRQDDRHIDLPDPLLPSPAQDIS